MPVVIFDTASAHTWTSPATAATLVIECWGGGRQSNGIDGVGGITLSRRDRFLRR